VVLRAEKLKDAWYSSKIQTWGDHVRARRLDLGLLQKEGCSIFGVDDTTINNWETNRTKPVVSFLPRIVEFLGYAPYMQPTSFGARLRMHRVALGLSQEKLANQLRVDESSI
jgi:transcriptional regulator with XRE-family HTH domain